MLIRETFSICNLFHWCNVRRFAHRRQVGGCPPLNVTDLMADITLETLGESLREKRGPRGIRLVADEIGISTATLSRIENGHLPDLETFRRVCGWLGADPSTVLGFQNPAGATTSISQVHFKKKKTQSKDTLQALAQMIVVAQHALDAEG